MKSWKRFLAKVMVAATVVTACDLYYLDLSGYGKAYAAVSNCVDDSYDAYGELDETRTNVDSGHSELSGELGVKIRVEDRAITNSADGYTDSTNWENSGNNIIKGMYTFNQRVPITTAQVKSGNWLTDSKYEAMAGTPTTEPLFVNMGGTQWIVDLQYRYINAPYTRTWMLGSEYYNYRYYSLADVFQDKVISPVTYTAIKTAPYDENIAETMKVVAPDGTEVYNFAYNFFEGMIDPDTQKARTTIDGKKAILSVKHKDLTGEEHTVKTYAVDKFANDESGFSSNHVASVDISTSQDYTTANAGNMLDDKYVSPNVARAIQIKQQIYALLQYYINAWNGQDDNYRVDQGIYDIVGYDSSQSAPDALTFMYTYCGMVRHSTQKWNNHAASLGDTYYSDSIFYPAIVSYLYDWEEYFLKDTMSEEYGSTHFQFGKLGMGANDNYKHVTNKLVEHYKGTEFDVESVNDIQSFFPLYIEDIPEHVNRDFWNPIQVCTSDIIKADLSYAEKAASLVGSSVCNALQNPEEYLKFGGSGLSPMNITTTEVGNKYYTDNNGRSYTEGAWFDLPTLYYRAIYSIMLNYGSLFYKSELEDLFYRDSLANEGGKDGIGNMKIGISLEKSLPAEEYDKHVNAVLAAVFGQGPNTETTEHITFIPLATFPYGGDLDGDMDDDRDRTRRHSYILNVAPRTLTAVSMHRPSYTYCVKIKIKDEATPGAKVDVQSKEYMTKDHIADSHTHNGIDHCPIEYQDIDCPFTGGTCNGSLHFIIDLCTNSHHTMNGREHLGNFEDTGEVTGENDEYRIWKCDCGFTRLMTGGANANAVPPGLAADKVNTSADPRYHVCKNCNGVGSVDTYHSKDVESHTHYFMDGALAVEGGETPTLENHAQRAYKYEYKVQVKGDINRSNNNNCTFDGTKSNWVESPKREGIRDAITQRFENVQWIDIISYTIWHLNNGSVKGLASILASPLSSNNISDYSSNTLVTKSINQKGYTVFNNSISDKTNYTFSDSKAHNTIFSKLGENNWQTEGVLKSSWNPLSKGNEGWWPTVSDVDSSIGFTTGDPLVFGHQYSYNVGDVPFIMASEVGPATRFINNDIASFKIIGRYQDGRSETIKLWYYPMSQGGRSHTTFYGFYNQALAHTFYFDYYLPNVKSGLPLLSYGNSLRVQGDYLTLEKTNGSKLTLAGMLYDTWDERFAQYNESEFRRFSSGKFSLMPNGYNKLTPFYSTCLWIPARLSVVFNRQSKENLYENADGIDNGVDCWIIHSFSRGINGDEHTSWDGITNCSGWRDNCDAKFCTGKPTGHMALTDKGSVNKYTANWLKTNAGAYDLGRNLPGTPKGERDFFKACGNAYIWSNLSKPIKLLEVHNQGIGYFNQFNVLDCDGNITEEKAVTLTVGEFNEPVLNVKLNHYLVEGKNGKQMMTSAVNSNNTVSQLEKTMPYVGYQSEGNGTQDITLSGGDGTQKGYDPGYDTKFESDNTFVSEGEKYRGGFEQFGTSQNFATYDEISELNVTDPQAEYHAGNSPNNEYPGSSFSVNYPWLSGLNVNRHLANGYYKTGQAAVHYSQVAKVDSPIEDMPAYSSVRNPKDDNSLYFITRYFRNDDKAGGHSANASPAKWSARGYLNSLVIYNPVSTQSAHIMTPTEFMPDASNKAKFNKYSGMMYIWNHVAAERDTRVAYKYELDNTDSEQYLTGSGIQNQTTKVREYKRKVLLSCSLLPTEYYKVSDYNLNRNSSSYAHISTAEINAGTTTYSVERTGEYSISRIETGNLWTSCKVNLIEGDIIKFSEHSKAVVLEMGTNNFEVPWTNVKSAYASLQQFYKDNLNDAIGGEDEDPGNLPDGLEREKIETVINYNNTDVGVPLYKGMTLSIGGNFSLRAGSLLKIQLDVTKNSEDGSPMVSDALAIDEAAIPDITVHSNTVVPSDWSEDKYTYTWYLEAKTDTQINSLPINVMDDCFVWKTENILTAEDVVLMSLANDSENHSHVMNATSYNFWHSNEVYNDLTETRRTFYNEQLVEIRGSYEVEGVTEYTESGLYISVNGGTVSISLKDEALENPHKVPNTNWKYYVLGWKTVDGEVIDSPDSALLTNNSTKLIIPASGLPITVGDIVSKVQSKKLGVYYDSSGGCGLIDIDTSQDVQFGMWQKDEDGNDYFSPRESAYTGYHVVEGTFALVQYSGGDDLTVKSGKVFSGGRPWRAYSGDSNSDDIVNGDGGAWLQNYAFECVYLVTLEDSLAYDIKWSTYHRWEQDNELWEKDWKEERVITHAFTEEAYRATFAQTLSLDDEYTIYWDNYTDLLEPGAHRWSNERLTKKTLGRGWDTQYLNAEAKSSDYWKAYIGSGNEPSVTDITKWIYSKYVIFNVDMYAFTTESTPYVYSDTQVENYPNGKWDPTTPAFKSNGKPNTIVYIPAGQKVYLGKYKAPDTPEDDSGRFVDFGADKNYTYHFWVPLSDGESDQNVVATYVMNSINGVDLNGGKITNKYISLAHMWDSSDRFPTFNVTKNPKPVGRPRVVDNTIMKDEWGNTILNAKGVKMDNNRQYISNAVTSGGTGKPDIDITLKDGYTRSGNSVNTQVVSLMGRVGGLTILDTGDPRYQDSFKLEDTSLSEDDDGYWAIAPIVRAIKSYSNVEGAPGSQKKYLTDIIDIRGRYLEHGDSRVSGDANCEMNTAASSDSYENTAWYRSQHYIEHHREILPFDHNFNVHEEIRKSVATAKLGYEIHCSIDTIGNFYGSNGIRPGQDENTWVNNNLDYGQTKVQVHPMYVAYNAKDGTFEAVDVYMKKGSSYELINAGSLYPSQEKAEAAGSNEVGPYYLDDCFDATYTSVVDTNTGGTKDTNGDGQDDTYVLDQNMLRKSITAIEAASTYNVVHKHATNPNENPAFTKGVTTSILDSNTYGSEGIGGSGLDYKYVYGNAQMLFLREFNRTFVGGTTLALNQTKEGTEVSSSCKHIVRSLENAQRYAQRWYFGLGLPASAKFVKHGDKPIEANFLKVDEHYYVLTLIDVYAIGEKWAIHYKSPVSKESIDIDGPHSSDEWNVYKETFPYAIPVCIYDLSKSTSSDDQSSRGSH